jgi:hypothetical protein
MDHSKIPGDSPSKREFIAAIGRTVVAETARRVELSVRFAL